MDSHGVRVDRTPLSVVIRCRRELLFVGIAGVSEEGEEFVLHPVEVEAAVVVGSTLKAASRSDLAN